MVKGVDSGSLQPTVSCYMMPNGIALMDNQPLARDPYAEIYPGNFQMGPRKNPPGLQYDKLLLGSHLPQA